MENTNENTEYFYPYANQSTHQEVENQMYFPEVLNQHPTSYEPDFGSMYSSSFALNPSHYAANMNQPSIQNQDYSTSHNSDFLTKNNMISSQHMFLESPAGSSTNPFGYTELEQPADNPGFTQAFNPFSDFQIQHTREEQDVFGDLINLANKNISQDIPIDIPSTSQHSITKDNALDKFHRTALVHSQSTESNLIYQLEIVQQPSRARMCGFGDKDRRSIVPAPIVQLFIRGKNGNEVDYSPSTDDESNTPASQVIVFSSTKSGECSKSLVKNLIGTTVVSANKLYDLDGKLGIFFIFHDLSLRTEGEFLLKFSLIDVGSPFHNKVNTESKSKVIQTVVSKPFTVYRAKTYPGVLQTSPLSLCFSRQGVKIPIRKESKMSKDRENHEND